MGFCTSTGALTMNELQTVSNDTVSEVVEYLEPVAPTISNSTEPADIIKATQSIRVAMVKKHMMHGVPNIGEESRDLLQVLRDLDQAALTTRKIDVEESQIGDAERLAAAQNELLRMLGGKNPFAVDIVANNVTLNATLPEVELPEPELVPGIDDQGTVPVDFDSFASAVSEDAEDD